MSNPSPTSQSVLLGIICMMGSMAFFSAMNVAIRFVSEDLHTTQIVFIRNMFSVMLLMPWIVYHGTGILKTEKLWGHFWRATIGIIGMQSWFYAITLMPLNQATALSFTAPIFTTIFAIIFLNERAGWRRWSAVIIGFVGTLIIINPDPAAFESDAFVVLFATSMWATAGLLVKKLTRTESPTLIIFYMAFFMMLWALPMAIPFWKSMTMDHLALCLCIALASTAAHWCLVRAYASADLVVLMPFDFPRLIFTAIFVYWAFGEIATVNTWIGGGLIVASTIYIAHREAITSRKITAKHD